MKGSMRQRGPDTWQLRVFAGVDGTGKKHWVSRTFHGGQREAETALSALVTEVDERRAPTCGALTVRADLEQWQQTRRLTVSESTLISQQRSIDLHVVPNIGARKLARLSPFDIEAMYARLSATLADKTLGGIHGLLDKALGDAVRKGLLPRNVMKMVTRLKPVQTDIIVPPATGVAEAIAAAPTIVGVGMRIIAGTGIRRGELLALRWSEIDLHRGLLRVNRNLQYLNRQIVILPPKTKASRRTIAIPAPLAASLVRYRKWQREEHLRRKIRTDQVIHNRSGEPFKPTTYSAAVKAAGDKVGLHQLGPHSIRHLHATHLIEQGINPRAVQERLGHANIVTTLQVYSHVLDHMQGQAATAAEGLCVPFQTG